MDSYPGVLSLVSMSASEKKLFIEYLEKVRPSLKARYLNEVFPDSDFLMFFDVFSGINIKVPSREETEKIVLYIKIYNYCKNHNFSDISYENASKLFGKRVSSIKKIVERIRLKMEEENGEQDL